MHACIWEGAPPKGETSVWDEDDSVLNFTPLYVELFDPLDKHFVGPGIESGALANHFIVVYWIKATESRWATVLCLDQVYGFADWMFRPESYVKHQEESAAAAWNAFMKARPLTSQLMLRGWQPHPESYSVCLLNSVDSDTTEEKWFLSSFFDNFQFSTPEEFVARFAEGNSREAGNRLLKTYSDILQEGIDPMVPEAVLAAGGAVQRAELKLWYKRAKWMLDVADLISGFSG
jgi:hypothetical protein